MTCFRSAALVLVIVGLAAPAAAEGDAEKGKKVFRKCQSCHMVGDGASNRVGPPLNGIVGGEIASAEGFGYSDVFLEKKAEGFTWTEENLHAYLEKPNDFLKRNKMSFAGLRKEQDRADVIAYLATFE
ncbi:MAG: cytochrome c family protein [Pseudomonadota bacterium]